MTIKTEYSSRNKILQLVQAFSIQDLQWLVKQLNRLLEEQVLPESATVDEAIELYLSEQCSLGRAAELSGVTRWELMDVLADQGTPVTVDANLSANELDDLVDSLEVRAAL